MQSNLKSFTKDYNNYTFYLFQISRALNLLILSICEGYLSDQLKKMLRKK